MFFLSFGRLCLRHNLCERLTLLLTGAHLLTAVDNGRLELGAVVVFAVGLDVLSAGVNLCLDEVVCDAVDLRS